MSVVVRIEYAPRAYRGITVTRSKGADSTHRDGSQNVLTASKWFARNANPTLPGPADRLFCADPWWLGTLMFFVAGGVVLVGVLAA